MEQQLSISESEWRVMKIVWSNSPQTLPEILDRLKETGWSKTTIQTYLARLVKKGALTTKRQGKGYLYFAARKDQLCETCRDRLDKNPMRILDCKIKHCQELGKDAPVILDYLCDDCKEHFEKLQEYLSVMGIDFDINPKIVRGLDYYTRTVFEFITDEIGAQGTVCGGGRYDGLIEQLGGKPTPALGFALGLERLLMVMDAQGCDYMEPKTCDLYIVPMGEDALKKAMGIASELREEGCFVEYDLIGKGLNAQMKCANKTGAKFVMVLGDNEIESGVAKLKNMATASPYF